MKQAAIARQKESTGPLKPAFMYTFIYNYIEIVNWIRLLAHVCERVSPLLGKAIIEGMPADEDPFHILRLLDLLGNELDPGRRKRMFGFFAAFGEIIVPLRQRTREIEDKVEFLIAQRTFPGVGRQYKIWPLEF
jgi:hypothetical protein